MGPFASGLTLVVMALDVPVGVLVGGAFVAGLVEANVLVSYLTLRTQLSPDALLGRIGATARTLSVGLTPVGALVGGILLDVVGGTATVVLIGAGAIGTGVTFALVPSVRAARLPRERGSA